MKKCVFLSLLMLLLLLLASCTAKESAEPGSENKSETVNPTLPSREAEKREALYVYGAGPQENSASKVVLKLNAAPVLLAASYVRLVGVVSSGGRPLALVEVGGRGQCVEPGSEILGYRVGRIARQTIEFIKEI